MRAPSYLALGLAVGVTGALVAQASTPGGAAGLALYKLVYEKAYANYVEEPDAAKMTGSAINGMLTSLDPHSNYLDSKALKDFQTSMRGEEFGGLGIEVMQEDGLIKVVSPIDDTPAARAGVMAGDRIVKIDQTQVKGLTLKEAVDLMRGKVKTHVAISILRGDVKDQKDARVLDIVREIIRVQPVRSHVESGDIGYIRITQFNEQTYDALKAAVAKFKTNGTPLKGYILDLRNNPGGLLSQSIRVVNSFIDSGQIVSTRGRTADLYQQYDARAGYNLSDNKPLAVLINGGSASASEIVSGALQDLHRATLIGTRSFGKGSVQTVLPLGEDGALKLTTARYYTPSGRSIQAKGIEPDYKIRENIPEELKGKVESLGEASLTGHLKNGEDEQKGSEAYVPPDPLKDTQLAAAVSLLHGKPPVSKTGEAPAN